jgi:hypothetical protein
MIRFGCPTCDKVYKVPVTLGGKPATCTRCSTRFLIPIPPKPPPPPVDVVEAEVVEDDPTPPRPTPVPARPVPPPVLDVLEAEVVEDVPVPPPASSQPPPAPAVGRGGGSAHPPLVTLEPCPDCRAVQTAPPADLGLWVECASCQTVFLAVEDKAAPPVPPGVTARSLRPPVTTAGFEAASPPPAGPPTPPEVVEAEVLPPAAADVPIAPCPKCRAELMVAETDLGGSVECPFCQTVYRATPPQPKEGTTLARVVRRNPAPPPSGGGKKPYQFRRDEDDRRRKRR